jgi:hypothetical protein
MPSLSNDTYLWGSFGFLGLAANRDRDSSHRVPFVITLSQVHAGASWNLVPAAITSKSPQQLVFSLAPKKVSHHTRGAAERRYRCELG